MWSIPVPLRSGEILSSWLVRSALALGCEPLSLTSVIWPTRRVWTTDIDRRLSDDCLAMLCDRSGQDTASLVDATLYPMASMIAAPGNLSIHRIWPWVLALGARNTRRRGGLQYCPLCLTESDLPHFHRESRLAWHVACKQHHCLLLDCCYRCGAALEPQRLKATDCHVAICATCKADLRNATSGAPLEDALAFQMMADKWAASTVGRTKQIGENVHDRFYQAKFLIGLLRQARAGKRGALFDQVRSRESALCNAGSLDGGLAFELLSVGERMALLAAVWRLMRFEEENGSLANTVQRSSRPHISGRCRARTKAPCAHRVCTRRVVERSMERLKRKVVRRAP